MLPGLGEHLWAHAPWFVVLVAVVVAAWRLDSLSGGGAVAAGAVGALVLAGTGWRGGAILVVFFVTSSVLSRLLAARDPGAGDAKGERRDGWQVVANGGAAALAGLLEWRTPGAGLWALTGALAVATADTWATALGGRSVRPPRLLLSRRVVEPGTNGGVTWAGSTGAAAGAVLLGTTAAALTGAPGLLPAAAITGILGMLLDSALGERWQGRFWCPACEVASEQRRHRCGTATRHAGGLTWLTNDGVNAAATGFGAAAGLAWWALA